MFQNTVALIGFGAIGTPIADKLHRAYGDNFSLVASGVFRDELEKSELAINGNRYSPKIISDVSEAVNSIDLLIVCVKNYDLQYAIEDIKRVVTDNTVILPLQNGIYSNKYFCQQFPENQVMQGYVQGPNTYRIGDLISYSNPGVMHIGCSENAAEDTVKFVYDLLKSAGIDVRIEENIRKMVWKKWMLNVAGNSVTALTGADYSKFKEIKELQELCKSSMKEFLQVADAENIGLTDDDISDIINYYVNYCGTKKTSMLEDVLNQRRTENEYLAGELLKMADKHSLDLPVTRTLFNLVKVKEELYIQKKK